MLEVLVLRILHCYFIIKEIKKRCAIITDLDRSITGKVTKAHKLGLSRKEKLRGLKKGASGLAHFLLNIHSR